MVRGFRDGGYAVGVREHRRNIELRVSVGVVLFRQIDLPSVALRPSESGDSSPEMTSDVPLLAAEVYSRFGLTNWRSETARRPMGAAPQPRRVRMICLPYVCTVLSELSYLMNISVSAWLSSLPASFSANASPEQGGFGFEFDSIDVLSGFHPSSFLRGASPVVRDEHLHDGLFSSFSSSPPVLP